MPYKYIETQHDVNEFVNYVHRHKGKVTKVKALRQGYEFDIVGPPKSDIGWGKRALDNYLNDREDAFDDTD